jgi:ADP-ribose pyrophosphatase YjhB (NUDIX family)
MGALDEWRYCPRCGEAIEKRDGQAVCGACGFRAYANSVPGVEAVIVDRDGRVLLGRRRFEPALGRWDFPGGFLDENEDPVEGLRREIREETGLEIETRAFVGIYLEPYDGRTVLCLTWRAAPSGGVERAGDDLSELQWFERDELPIAELAFAHYERALSDALRDEHA